MKHQATQYLALDVHQATVVGCVRDERGKIVMRATVLTEAKVIVALVKSAGFSDSVCKSTVGSLKH